MISTATGAKTPATGISGRTVFLDTDGDGDGVLDATESRVTTTSSGAFKFAGLKPGTYAVRALLPSGTVATTPPVVRVQLASGVTVGNLLFGAGASSTSLSLLRDDRLGTGDLSKV